MPDTTWYFSMLERAVTSLLRLAMVLWPREASARLLGANIVNGPVNI